MIAARIIQYTMQADCLLNPPLNCSNQYKNQIQAQTVIETRIRNTILKTAWYALILNGS